MPSQQQWQRTLMPNVYIWMALTALLLALMLPFTYLTAFNTAQPKNGYNFTAAHPTWSLSGVSPMPSLRSRILPFGARVACWPSSGGIWIKHAIPAELDLLHLSRTDDVPRPWPSIKAYSWNGVYLNEGDARPTHPSVIEEDLFCESLRLSGAHFWNMTPPATSDGIITSSATGSLKRPIELTIPPKIHSHLGFAWDHQYGGAILVNLTEARQRYGIELEGFYGVQALLDRFPVAESLDGIACSHGTKACQTIWCRHYPDFCHESHWLFERSRAVNRWHDYLFPQHRLKGEELAAYGTDQWIRDERTHNFYWKHGGIAD